MLGRHKVDPPAIIRSAKEYREKTNIPNNEPYSIGTKIQARTDQTLYHEIPDQDEEWRAKLKRRTNCLQQGLFSRAEGEVYKQIGQVELDTRKLTLDVLVPGWVIIEPPTIKRDYLRKHNDKGAKAVKKRVRTLSGKVIARALLETQALEEEAGIKSIAAAIKESKNNLHKVKNGRPYEPIIKELREGKGDKCVISGLQMKNLSEEKLSEWDSDTLIDNTGDDDTDVARETRNVKKDSLVYMLDMMYNLLCSIYNLKVKYLKRKVPLKLEYVKSLRYWPSYAFEQASPPGGILANYDRPLLPGNSQLSIVNQSSRSSFLCPSRNASFSSKGKRSLGRRMTRTPRDKDAVIENWEDFLNHEVTGCSPQSPRRRSSAYLHGLQKHHGRPWIVPMLHITRTPSTADTEKKETSLKTQTNPTLLTPGTNDGSRRQHRVTRLPSITTHIPRRSLPPWQQIAQAEKAIFALKKDYYNESDGENTLVEEMVEKMDNQRCEMFKVQREMSKKAAREIKDFKTVRSEGFYQKFHILDQMSSDVLGHRKRRQMDIVTEKILEEENNTEKNQADWYKNIVAQCPLKVMKDDRVQEALTKLSKFSHHSVQEQNPHCKEAMCLLTMSLPAVELLRKETQDAFLTIMVDVLFGRPELFNQWMHTRGIEVMVDWREKYADVINY